MVDNNYVLLMNGDIYSKRGDSKDSDTHWLSNQLNECSSDEDLLDLFREIKGPFSLIFYNTKTQDLYFLRDSIGRQTLLLAEEDDGTIVISSVLGRFQLKCF